MSTDFLGGFKKMRSAPGSDVPGSYHLLHGMLPVRTSTWSKLAVRAARDARI